MESAPPALEGEVLTPGPLGKILSGISDGPGSGQDGKNQAQASASFLESQVPVMMEILRPVY